MTSLLPFLKPSDEALMRRVQNHADPQAFAVLVARWEGRIQSLCTRMVADPETGRDLTQETFSRLFSSRTRYQPGARFSTYLWRIALNLCYTELRRRRRWAQLTDPQPIEPDGPACDRLPAEAPSPADSLVEQETGVIVRAALTDLQEPYRTVVILRHYEGLKFREIAEVLDIPEGTVKSRMAEALDQLARRLQPILQPADRETAPPAPHHTPYRSVAL